MQGKHIMLTKWKTIECAVELHDCSSLNRIFA
jgi:hypothetical protein